MQETVVPYERHLGWHAVMITTNNMCSAMYPVSQWWNSGMEQNANLEKRTVVKETRCTESQIIKVLNEVEGGGKDQDG
jgi:hypothetical protein